MQTRNAAVRSVPDDAKTPTGERVESLPVLASKIAHGCSFSGPNFDSRRNLCFAVCGY
jgi:hypothetical protein